jgi:hypothetical protein
MRKLALIALLTLPACASYDRLGLPTVDTRNVDPTKYNQDPVD